MTTLPLHRESIEPRLDGMQRDMLLLKQFAEMPFEKFQEDAILDRVQLRLRFVLEGIFHIGAHVLSRIPGCRFTEYKEIARTLGTCGIVEKKFAEQKLVPLAGYRNRLTHLYADVTPRELYDILHNDLDDVEVYMNAIKNLLLHPERFNLAIE